MLLPGDARSISRTSSACNSVPAVGLRISREKLRLRSIATMLAPALPFKSSSAKFLPTSGEASVIRNLRSRSASWYYSTHAAKLARSDAFGSLAVGSQRRTNSI